MVLKLPDLLRDTIICHGIRNPASAPPSAANAESAGEVLLEEQIPAAILQETGIAGRPCVNIFGAKTRNLLLDGWAKVREEQPFDWVHLSGGWSNPGAIESNLTRGLAGNIQFSDRTVEDVIQQATNERLPPIRFDYPLAWQGIWATALRGLAEELTKTADTNPHADVTLSSGGPGFVDLREVSGKLYILAKDYLSQFDKSEFGDGSLEIRAKSLFEIARDLLTSRLDKNLQAKIKTLLVPLKEQQIGNILKIGSPTFWSTGPFYNGKCDPWGKTTSTPFTAAYEHGFLTIEETVKFADRETEFGISNATGSVAIATTASNLFLLYLANGPEIATKAYIAIAESKRQVAQGAGRTIPWDHSKIGDYADGFVMMADQVAPEVRRILETQRDAVGLQYAFQVHVQRGLPTGISLFAPTVDHAFVKHDNRWDLIDTLKLAKAARAA